jgi:molybdate transport system ATP-binding protein
MTLHAPASSAPAWDLRLRRRLEHAGSRFDLDVVVRSDARRLALFGPSGAGKTQVLRLIAGLSRPDAGHVSIAGRTLFDSARRIDLPARERRLAYLFQDHALFPHLSVRRNIAFGLSTGWRPARSLARDERVARWIERFQLGAVAELLPHQLSGGQRQRTALARALISDPAALLLDEPFSALDRPLRERLREDLLGLQQDLDLPLILVTHDEADVAHLAEAVIRLEAGRMSAFGPPAPTAATLPA